MNNNSEKLITLAQNIADDSHGFFDIKGPGRGDKATHAFMKDLQSQAKELFDHDFSEQKICGDNKFAVDFYFPSEATIIEIALTIRNSNSEYYKDIFKALLSKKAGNPVEKLIFISKPGALKRHKEPASQAIVALARDDFGISIVINELVDNSATM